MCLGYPLRQLLSTIYLARRQRVPPLPTMSVTSRPPVRSAQPVRPSPAVLPVSPAPLESAYGRSFWFAYAANFLAMIAVSLLYRYADFVSFLGGSELDLGRIVGAGMIGSMLMRFAQGVGIDRYGSRQIWLGSLGLFIACVLGHLLIERPDTPAIYLLRIGFSTSLAGVFGASITSVARRLSVERMAEVIGMLGTSGFIAMAMGPFLGDWLCGARPMTRERINLMFLVAAGLGAASFVCTLIATRGETRPQQRRRSPHLLWLLRRYHPGGILVMSVAMGVGFSLPTTFLAPFAADLGIRHIGGYFLLYAGTAFMTRMLTRRFPAQFGIRPVIFFGVAMLVVSLLLYLPVTNQWTLLVPGFFAGVAHALLFPAIVAGGSSAFPDRYRGLGTTLMLAMFDLGTLVGAPCLGGIVTYSKRASLPPYPTMFLTIAAGVVLVSAFYAVVSRGREVA